MQAPGIANAGAGGGGETVVAAATAAETQGCASGIHASQIPGHEAGTGRGGGREGQEGREYGLSSAPSASAAAVAVGESEPACGFDASNTPRQGGEHGSQSEGISTGTKRKRNKNRVGDTCSSERDAMIPRANSESTFFASVLHQLRPPRLSRGRLHQPFLYLSAPRLLVRGKS